jgi:hypothetical protein
LEGGKRFKVCDISKKKDAFAAFIEQAGDDAEYVLSTAELAEVTAMRESVMTEPNAKRIIENTQHEVCFFWEGPYGRAKARLDGFSERLIWDYKTTKKITPKAFWRTAENMAYLLKMGWYQEAVQRVTGKCLPVSIIVQEQDEPHDRWVCNIPNEFVSQGREQAVELAMKYHVAEITNCFLGVVQGVIQFERNVYGGEVDASDGDGNAEDL